MMYTVYLIFQNLRDLFCYQRREIKNDIPAVSPPQSMLKVTFSKNYRKWITICDKIVSLLLLFNYYFLYPTLIVIPGV